MIGRTHGIHAEPITFGLKLALWYQEMARHRERFDKAVEDICVGQISGAVGTFAQISPKVEAYVCRKAGLKPAPISNQIIQRDRHAYYFATLAVIASSLEKFAVEIRHLQRTEVQEAEEPFTAGQKGSSAMPHKRNPILSENVSGMARLMRSYAQAALENVALWHERDISHSSVERVIAPDATIALDFMLRRMTYVIGNLCVYPENMKRNLEKSGGAVYSEKILLALVEQGRGARPGVPHGAEARTQDRQGRRRFEARTACGRGNSPLFIGAGDRRGLGRRASSGASRFHFPPGVPVIFAARVALCA